MSRRTMRPWLGGTGPKVTGTPLTKLMPGMSGVKTIKPFTVMFSKRHFDGPGYCIKRHGVMPLPVVLSEAVVDKIPQEIKAEIGSVCINTVPEDEVLDQLVLNGLQGAFQTKKKTVLKRKKQTPESPRPTSYSSTALQSTHQYRAQQALARLQAWRSTPQYQTLWETSLSRLTINKDTHIEGLSEQLSMISGETGCGKSTQIPQLIYEQALQRGEGVKIIVTQPRRIAAISLAERTAAELGEQLGESVGYQVSIDKVLPTGSSSITFCTTGILVRQMTNHSIDLANTHIVVDEAHEKTVENDYLLYLIKQALPMHPTLKVTLMSATVAFEPYIEYFHPLTPSLHTFTSRRYPITEHHLDDLPLTLRCADPSYGLIEPPAEDIVSVIDWALKTTEGAVLVFLPGAPSIKSTATLLKRTIPTGIDVVTLHALIPRDMYKKAFNPPPPGCRKVVLATNIAESSITIPDVTAVVNTGLMNELRVDHRRDTSVLETVRCSKSNNRQRAGRAGRVAPGTAVHMLLRSEAEELPEHETPEMLRASLDQVILELYKSDPTMDVTSTMAQFMNAPPPLAVQTTLDYLLSLGALVVKDGHLTISRLGLQLAAIPVSPANGKLLLLGCALGCVDPALTLASLSQREAFFKIGDEITQDSHQVTAARIYKRLERECGGVFTDARLKEVQNTRLQLTEALCRLGLLEGVSERDNVLHFRDIPQNRHGDNDLAIRAALAMALSDNLCAFDSHANLMTKSNCNTLPPPEWKKARSRNVRGVYAHAQIVSNSSHTKHRTFGITVLSPVTLVCMHPRVAAIQYKGDTTLTGLAVGDWATFVLPTMHAKYLLALHTMMQKAMRQHLLRKSTFRYHTTQYVVDTFLRVLWAESHPGEPFPKPPHVTEDRIWKKNRRADPPKYLAPIDDDEDEDEGLIRSYSIFNPDEE
eukprot:TRINITY_DN29189_c0_g1_i1.p1 TRINITY_DN29189_c0_g1~~TRINITY_DN29189_c0_g1_i1.p1  ORF type:complete len:941 (+),score=208.08 TRINITY_DN29189_c0_g1_i1:38-2824(+)